jgi:sialate O-acetylesterase
MRVKGSDAVIRFTETGSGLVAGRHGGGTLQGFGIAGSDGKFVWAQARIEGNTVVVHSDEVPHPVSVRYNWADNPPGNLYNKEGLPASGFRTDK